MKVLTRDWALEVALSMALGAVVTVGVIASLMGARGHYRVDGADAGLHAAPVTLRAGGKVLVLEPSINYDAVGAECARKMLAAVARNMQPGWGEYEGDRVEAAWRACGEFRR